MLLILTEKPDEGRNFAKALGGMTGSFNGQSYKIVSARGHLLEFKEPHEQVPISLSEQYKSWDLEHIPWDLGQLSWEKTYKKGKNPRTKRVESTKSLVDLIKKEASACDGIVIATDVDPSGEGELIAVEILQAIGWKKKIYRMYFTDSTPKSVQKAFKEMKDISNLSRNGDYLKADIRSKWDFASMTLTRIATNLARQNGYATVVRQGRLKSVMVKLVSDQLDAIRNYVKKPYFEVKFKDDNDHVYARKIEKDDDTTGIRFDSEQEAQIDQQKFHQSAVKETNRTKKSTPPIKLLDLSNLSAILSKKGFKPKEVLETYQKMYEAHIVSYPRTEDKYISVEQFNEMLPLVDQIAGVVNVDTSLLTHRQARSTHVKDGGAHGANRPGVEVPPSLSSLEKFGPSATAIYETLAKNFLAMFAEDYVYESVNGQVVDYPNFVTSFSIPISLGWKQVFKTDDDDEDEGVSTKSIGTQASPFLFEGANKKPTWPTITWLTKQLEKYDVGTGATRTGTIADITANTKYALMTEKKGKLDLTQTGQISGVLLENTFIANPDVTEKLFKNMQAIAEFKVDPNTVLNTVTEVVSHDKNVMMQNAKQLKTRIGKAEKGMTQYVQKEKVEGIWNGQTVKFSKIWAGHEFTDEECEKLLNGETIEIEANKKGGGTFKCRGKLAEQTFKKDGKTYEFVGFKMEERPAANTMTSMTANFPTQWGGYTFTKDDEKRLRNGEKIQISPVSKKTGNTYDVDVTFELLPEQGNFKERWGIKPHFNK